MMKKNVFAVKFYSIDPQLYKGGSSVGNASDFGFLGMVPTTALVLYGGASINMSICVSYL